MKYVRNLNKSTKKPAQNEQACNNLTKIKEPLTRKSPE